MAIKGENDNRFAAIDALLNEAFGKGAAAAAQKEEFLNEIPEGAKGPRKLALLGDARDVNKLKNEIKQVIRDKAPALTV